MQVSAMLTARREMVSNADSRVDWAMAEALAIGTLLLHRQVNLSQHCCNAGCVQGAAHVCMQPWACTATMICLLTIAQVVPQYYV